MGIGWAGRISNAYYEQLAKEKGWTPEERDKRNEDAFNGKEGDIEILDPGDPAGDETSRTWCLKNSLRHVKHN